jgi:hypothetical protein
MSRKYNSSYRYMPEYGCIASHYGSQRAERSGVPLMAHIDEGCEMLMEWKQPLYVQQAFCLHPLVQNHVSFCGTIEPKARELAKEYAEKANSYLCRPDTDIITNSGNPSTLAAHLGKMSKQCAYMLLADKIQNQKDFRIYHMFTHNRAKELERYFELWIKTLREFYIYK